jgi:phosphoglycolate phosphatase
MNIFFDLDGTLIDSRKRLYELFQHLVPASVLTYEGYWELKKQGIGHKEILTTQFNYSTENFNSFEKEWMSKIELDEWLDFDRPFDGVFDYLTMLKKDHRLFLVTARQSEETALKQIEKYGWTGVFEKVLVTSQKVEKHLLIAKSANVTNHDWIVGDTGKDIQTGKLLAINTAAVLTGFLSKEKLEKYNPDIIVTQVNDLKFVQ